MAERQNGRVAEWHNCRRKKTLGKRALESPLLHVFGRSDKVAELQNGRKVAWQSGRMAEWQSGTIAGGRRLGEKNIRKTCSGEPSVACFWTIVGGRE